MKCLRRSFYQRDTVIVAQALLGKFLVHEIDGQKISGYIVETEAYRSDDPACHAYLEKKTTKNRSLFGPVGHAYVYISYGIHYCVNLVARDKNSVAGGVLIRALQPVDGIEIMRKNRKKMNPKDLTSGPGKLTQALGITLQDDGIDLTLCQKLYVAEGIEIPPSKIIAASRIGISVGQDLLWRFYIDGNEFVSK